MHPFDGHTLCEALELAEILSELRPTVAVVDRGYRDYRGAEIAGVTIWRSGHKRGVTRAVKAMIHRGSAIEPTIGHIEPRTSSAEAGSIATSGQALT